MGQVKEAFEEKFGSDYEIHKEECVGHVQKRLGTALRKYKKDKEGRTISDGKSVGEKGRLTNKIIDQMENYYGEAIGKQREFARSETKHKGYPMPYDQKQQAFFQV